MEFNELNLTELDKDLSEEQRKEWNAIYASYRAGSLLTGKVAGTDSISVNVKNEETGRFEQKNILCLYLQKCIFLKVNQYQPVDNLS